MTVGPFTQFTEQSTLTAQVGLIPPGETMGRTVVKHSSGGGGVHPRRVALHSRIFIPCHLWDAKRYGLRGAGFVDTRPTLRPIRFCQLF
jgi:hypothetical protein